MAVNPNMANREVADLVLLDYKTKKVFLPIDFANVTTTDFTANRTFAKGGQGAPNRVGFDSERAGTLKVDTQIMPVKLFALLSGQDIGKVAKIMKREVLTATTDGIELSETPKAGTVQVLLFLTTPVLRSVILPPTTRRLLVLACRTARTMLPTTSTTRMMVFRLSSLILTHSRVPLRSTV